MPSEQIGFHGVLWRFWAMNGRAFRVVTVFGALVSGCATQGSTPDERASTGSVQQALAADEVPVMARDAPAEATVLIRHVTDQYEIELRSPQGFSPRAFDPVLRIGTTEFREHRESPTVGEFGVVFTISEVAFGALAEGSAVLLGYGPELSGARNFGTLNKSALTVSR